MILSGALCLALNVYHEARSESIIGQYAVAMVTMNRVASSRYPDDVCSVVQQGYGNSTCQFSWYCDGKSDKPRDMVAWGRAQQVAEDVLVGRVTDITGGSTHYHAEYVRPYWADKITYVGQHGRHIFYKE